MLTHTIIDTEYVSQCYNMSCPTVLSGEELDGHLAESCAGAGGIGHHPVHAQVHVAVDPSGRRVGLTVEGEELVRVEVDEVQAVVSRGQLVSHVERDGGVRGGGHEVALAVQQTVAAPCGVVPAVEVDVLVDGVDLGVVLLSSAVTRCYKGQRERERS